MLRLSCWEGFCLVAVHGLFLAVASLVGAHRRVWCVSFGSCDSRALELWLTGLAAPRHVGSSQTRDWQANSLPVSHQGSPLTLISNPKDGNNLASVSLLRHCFRKAERSSCLSKLYWSGRWGQGGPFPFAP